jgi:hypothetical protein
MKTDRELLEDIISKLDHIEKKMTGRFIMSLNFILIAASISL